MARVVPSRRAPSAPAGSIRVLRGVERLFELLAVVGVVLYVVGFVTPRVDLALGVALGVGGAVGNLACGFCRTLTVESG